MSATTSNFTNVLVHTAKDSNSVTVTAAAGINHDAEDRKYVMVGRKIQSEAIESYDDMTNSIAQTVAAMRGQYHIFEDKYQHNAWQKWLETGVRLTWAPGERYALYELNSVNGRPCFKSMGHEKACKGTEADTVKEEMYKYIENIHNLLSEDVPPPYQAFARYGNTLFSDLDFKVNCTVGVDLPVVSTEHMKSTDSSELQWLNVALHMVTKNVVRNLKAETSHLNLSKSLFQAASTTSVTSVATQAVAPYPVQWKETSQALSQALEIAAGKLLGANTMQQHMAHKGDAMNVIMGAAYFCIQPHTNQVHLKTMYSQSDKIMPDDTKTFIRDISNSHVKFIQALQALSIAGDI